MEDFRGITLISVLAKWFMGSLMILIRRAISARANPRWRRCFIFGYEENHSTEQICVGLSALLQRGEEWKEQAPVFIVSADVKAAFDNLTLQAVLKALVHWELPEDLIACLLEESLDLVAGARLCGMELPETFPFNNSVRQG
eukprot:6745693-Karenia_brevis.AAC.1